MITLAAGVPVDRTPKPWWVAREAQCPKCKARIRLEEGDEAAGAVTTHAERHPGGKQWVDIQCPTPACGTVIKLELLNAPFGEAAEFARREETPLA